MNQLERVFAVGVMSRGLIVLVTGLALLTLTVVAAGEARAGTQRADSHTQAVKAKKKKAATKVKTLRTVKKGTRLTITARTNVRRGKIMIRVIPQNGGKAVKRAVRINKRGVAKTVFKVKKPSWGYVYVFSMKGKKLNFLRTAVYR